VDSPFATHCRIAVKQVGKPAEEALVLLDSGNDHVFSAYVILARLRHACLATRVLNAASGRAIIGMFLV
jgi:hypothetical protein